MKYLLGLNAEMIEDRIDSRISGVGMIRSEYLCRKIGEYFTCDSCIQYIENYLSNICDIFSDTDVWYRVSDFIVQEVNTLVGVDHILYEHDYILGLRGVRRGLKYVNTFIKELAMISNLAKKKKNLHILIPYIKDIEELNKCIELLDKLNFKNKYGIMAEIPSVIFSLEDFLSMGITNVTIGINDLTTLLLGAYRTSEHYNCNHTAVYKAIEKTVCACSKYNVPVSIGGMVNKNLLLYSKKIGVDNFIVNYPQLPDILDIDPSKLNYLYEMDEIKKDTRAKRKELDYKRMKGELEENGLI